MAEGDGHEVSRRGLFGAFRRGARVLRSGLDDVQRAATPGSPEAAADAAAGSGPRYPRLLRRAEEVAAARPSGHSVWSVDLTRCAPEPGGSAIVIGGGLPEPLVVVRVNATHWGCCSAECPIDGSHVVWDAAADQLRCPACASLWRLDGDSMGGPADSPLARLLVDAYQDDDGGVEARIRVP